ncbi:alkaline phosphatase family protein [Desulfomicrobium sp. ZS1]|uniref:alkaline phosphatase family protein n=1 Tax=Desulfomicrobium sp. ZS1 TaxID=2952228 RepID=UPI0020B3E9F5|nr:alkaline phosphatase family protein [Desulfomicrobium sp. ZS1]UTF50410.1 alkaline phosphatase family protein [Desulfomicrobium sp. ZS1]
MHPSRLVFLGLDGLPWSLVQNLCAQGLLPNLATIAGTPGCRAISAELPELSPVNWTSLFTATPPGEHGVYGFTRLDPQSYELQFTDFTHVHGATIFERLAGKGLFCKVVNMPNLAPVRPMRSMLVAGFPAQELRGSVHPPALEGILADHGYTIEADTVRGATDPAFLLDDLHRSLACREKALDLLWPDLAWDLFFFVLTETDRLGHFLFPALVEPYHPWRSEALRFMAAWDRLIGKFFARYLDLPEPKRLLIMADHGFTTLTQEVDLNAWLREKGLLHLSRQPASEWDTQSISPATKAFALDPGRIYLHTRERFTHGALPRAEADVLGADLIRALSGLTWRGRQVIRHVHRGRDLYHGPKAHLAPDLVLIPQPGFDLKGKFGRTDMFGHFGRQGMHTADDVFFYDSMGASARTPTEIGQAILDHFDIPAATFEA